MRINSRIIGASILFLSPAASWACATCGCSLSPDAALGYFSVPGGWSVSVDYTFINQNQLRHGAGSISPSDVQAIPGQEVEHQTINRYITLGLGYAFNQDWNIKLLAPYIDRSHSTYGTTSTPPLTPDQLSFATTKSWGDFKLIASYQGFLPTKNLGVQLGVKFPTGNYGGPSASNTSGLVGQGSVGHSPVNFGPEGNSGSTYLDASLQAGTGSTDVIVGGYYYQPVSQDFDAFISGQFQFAATHLLDQEGEDFRPGNSLNVSVGIRYEAYPRIVPQVQLNMTRREHDQGALADTRDTAGTVAYLSPGISMSIIDNTQVYAFVQVPVYSNLAGYQLFPRYTASVGIAHHF